MKPLRDGLFASTIVAAVLMFVATWFIFGPEGATTNGNAAAAMALYGCMLSGLVAGLLIVIYTEVYTGSAARPVIQIAKRSQSGPALNVISGTAVGMQSTGLPIVTVAATLLGCFILGHLCACRPGSRVRL